MIETIYALLSEIGSYLLIASVIVFLQSFYDPDIKWNKKKALILGIIASADFTTSLIVPDNIIIPELLIFVSIAVSVFDSEKRKIIKAMKVFFTEILFLISTTNTIMVVSAFISPNYDIESLELTPFENYATVIINIIFFGAVFLYLRLRIAGKDLFIPITKKERIFIGIYLFYSFVLFCVTAISTENRVNSYPNALEVMMAVNTILLTILLPIFIYRNRISEFFRESTEYQKIYIEAELKHFQQYKFAQEETKRFRHDIKNNLICLSDMLSQNKTEEGKEYLKSLLGEVHRLLQKYVSGDEILDSIISSKVCVMEEANIGFSLDGVIAGGLNLEPLDICSIFSNALDNAIEATTPLPLDEKHIKMKIKGTDKLWLIQITNPVAKDINTQRLFNNGYTTKKDKSHHGIGTFNIKRGVEKYGGAVQAKCKDCMLTLEIVLPKQPLTTE